MSTEVKIEDLYARIIRLIETGQTKQAVDRILKLHEKEAQFDLVRRLLLDLDLARALAHAFVLDLDRSFDRAHALDRALALARANALVRALDLERARSLTKVINQVLESLLNETAISPPLSSTIQLTFGGIDTLTPQVLSDHVAPYLQALVD